MQTLNQGYRSLSLLVNLNWDLLFTMATIGLALLAGAFISTSFM